MQAQTNLPPEQPQSSWDADFDAMSKNSTAAINAEIVDEPVVDARIKRPIHKNPQLKFVVLFLGSALLVGGGAFAFFGNSFNGDAQVAKAPKTPNNTPLSTSDQERLANAEAANAMGGSGKAFEAHNQDKKEEPTPAKSPEAAQKPAPEVAKAPAATATKPVVVQASKPAVATATPVVYQQPRVIKQAPTPSVQPTRIAANNNQDSRIKSLESKIDKLTVAMERQNSQRAAIKAIDKPTTVATAPTSAKENPAIKTAQLEKAPVSQSQVQHIAQTSPSIDGRATAKFFDPLTVSAGGGSGNSSNSTQSMVRIQLTQPIPTSDGLEIPAGSIVAMQVAVASNGMVSGSSTGVWDIKTQKQLNVPAGALVVEGMKGQPLIAQSIKPNDDESQMADTQSAVWQAMGSGVDGLTRPESNSTVTAGTIVTTATSGGSRDILVNAAGGFAKSKASSLEKDATKRRDKIAAQSELWHLPQNTEIVVSTRPPAMAANPTGNHYQQYQPSNYQQTQPNNYQQQYQQYPQYQSTRYQTETLPPVPTRYAVNPTQR
jgi:hypothetical protein